MRFSIRDLLWLIAFSAVGLLWYLERSERLRLEAAGRDQRQQIQSLRDKNAEVRRQVFAQNLAEMMRHDAEMQRLIKKANGMRGRTAVGD
jgi:hypothetical protein